MLASAESAIQFSATLNSIIGTSPVERIAQQQYEDYRANGGDLILSFQDWAAVGMPRAGAMFDRTVAEQKILSQIGSSYKNNPLREEYEHEVAAFSIYAERIKPGMTDSELKHIDYEAVSARRSLGVKYKDMTDEPLRDYIYHVNIKRCADDPLGPTVEFLLNNGKAYTKIIFSASRLNSNVDRLLDGFESWLKDKPDSYIENILNYKLLRFKWCGLKTKIIEI